jgi:hypothetical protein
VLRRGLILKNGEIAAVCNLEEERRANRKFLELETRGATAASWRRSRAWAARPPGWATAHEIVMPDGVEIRQLYALAAEPGADPAAEPQARFAGRHLPESHGGPNGRL